MVSTCADLDIRVPLTFTVAIPSDLVLEVAHPVLHTLLGPCPRPTRMFVSLIGNAQT